MIRAIREHVTVEREGVIEIRHPGLSVGMTAEVVVLVRQPAVEDRPLVSFLGKAKGCFANAAEVDAFLRAERDAWDPPLGPVEPIVAVPEEAAIRSEP